MRLRVYTAQELPDKMLITSGVSNLDSAIVGLPVPGVVELFGPPGSGKSLLSMLFKPELYVDVEGALQGSWLRLWSPSTRVVKAMDWNDVRDFLEESLDRARIIVVDSIASIGFDDDRPGALARHVGSWVVKKAPRIKETCLVLLNHVRVEFGPYPSLSSPGGWGLKHACDLRLKVRRGELKSLVWHESVVEVVKSKLGPSGKRASVFFNLKTGEVSETRPVLKKGEVEDDA